MRCTRELINLSVSVNLLCFPPNHLRLAVGEDETKNCPFLKCEYNRDGDSFRYSLKLFTFYRRSPFSNEWFPPFEDAPLPNERLREFEVKANKALSHYANLYFESCITSAYFFETAESGFGSVFLIKKGMHMLIYLFNTKLSMERRT